MFSAAMGTNTTAATSATPRLWTHIHRVRALSTRSQNRFTVRHHPPTSGGWPSGDRAPGKFAEVQCARVTKGPALKRTLQIPLVPYVPGQPIPVGYPAEKCLVPDLERKPLDEI